MRLARPSTRRRPTRRRVHLAAAASTAILSLAVAAVPAQAAPRPSAPDGASTVSLTATVSGPSATSRTGGLDRTALRETLDALHQAGMYGAYSAVRDGSDRWKGAAGVVDVDTGRPVRADFEHRIGSVTKTFTAVAVLQQVQRGRIDLDAPIGRYLPELVRGERGREVTVRMLLNHTSGIGDYILGALPELATDPGKALDGARLRHWEPEELVRIGLAAEPAPRRGTFSYSNTNYIVAGLLLEKVTGQDAEDYITREVIREAGLRHTYFPDSPRLTGPHARMYESFYGYIDPPRDYGVYDASLFGTAGAMVSTTQDLNDFFRRLLGGKLLGPEALRAMKTTVPMAEGSAAGYGLGIYTQPLGGRSYWGHDGIVFGAGTLALSSEDGRRQLAVGYNLTKYQRFDESGEEIVELPNPIDPAFGNHVVTALTDTFPSAAPDDAPSLLSVERLSR
ncbi:MULTISPECIES: serine hydrolase domain-containing protein [Streptomyces]|nr:serine hydrolase domain-containing protein [Streptomyces ruber]